jgi:signal transduction histidine kinase
LAGPGYCYAPAGKTAAPLNATQLDALLHARVTDGQVIALEHMETGGYGWAIPLWSEHGMIGALLVGPKQDGGLYSQEEMEIAQAGSERIVDMLAREQMTSRLLAVQRTRAAEQQLTDMQTRRLLHDEILPALHLIALRLSVLPVDAPEREDLTCAVTGIHRQIANLLTERQAAASKPLASSNGPHELGAVLADLVRSEFAHAFDAIHWQRLDSVPLAAPTNLAAETLVGAVREAIRNAARHGRGDIPDRPLALTLSLCAGDEIVVRVQDNGVGAVFATGKNSNGGAGSGLALHNTLLAIAGGYLAVESSPGAGTSVTLGIPRAQIIPEAG